MNTELDLLNVEVLDDSILNNTFKYSNAEGEDDIEYEDEENTDSEPSDEEGVSEEELPKFRTLVKNKKLELKAQYGKATISIGECGVKPLNPDIKYPNVVCLWDCSKSKNSDKPCCVKNREQAQKRAEHRKKIQDWEECRSKNKGVIKSGWRKKWREFKKAGGLAQLKLQARGLAPIPTQAPTTSPRGLMFRGKLLGAPIRKTLGLDKEKIEAVKNIDETKPDDSAKRIAEESSDKILGMPKMVAIGLGVAVLAIGGFVAYRYIKAKK